MTACQLLETGDPVLKGFLVEWADQKRLALPLVDYFLEQVMEKQAEAVRWLVQVPDRFSPSGGSSGPFPNYYTGQKDWGWRIDQVFNACYALPPSLFAPNERETPGDYIISKQSPEHALCLALDLYKGPQ
jgi:hypothetical protein